MNEKDFSSVKVGLGELPDDAIEKFTQALSKMDEDTRLAVFDELSGSSLLLAQMLLTVEDFSDLLDLVPDFPTSSIVNPGKKQFFFRDDLSQVYQNFAQNTAEFVRLLSLVSTYLQSSEMSVFVHLDSIQTGIQSITDRGEFHLLANKIPDKILLMILSEYDEEMMSKLYNSNPSATLAAIMYATNPAKENDEEQYLARELEYASISRELQLEFEYENWSAYKIANIYRAFGLLDTSEDYSDLNDSSIHRHINKFKTQSGPVVSEIPVKIWNEAWLIFGDACDEVAQSFESKDTMDELYFDTDQPAAATRCLEAACRHFESSPSEATVFADANDFLDLNELLNALDILSVESWPRLFSLPGVNEMLHNLQTDPDEVEVLLDNFLDSEKLKSFLEFPSVYEAFISMLDDEDVEAICQEYDIPYVASVKKESQQEDLQVVQQDNEMFDGREELPSAEDNKFHFFSPVDRERPFLEKSNDSHYAAESVPDQRVAAIMGEEGNVIGAVFHSSMSASTLVQKISQIIVELQDHLLHYLLGDDPYETITTLNLQQFQKKLAEYLEEPHYQEKLSIFGELGVNYLINETNELKEMLVNICLIKDTHGLPVKFSIELPTLLSSTRAAIDMREFEQIAERVRTHHLTYMRDINSLLKNNAIFQEKLHHSSDAERIQLINDFNKKWEGQLTLTYEIDHASHTGRSKIIDASGVLIVSNSSDEIGLDSDRNLCAQRPLALIESAPQFYGHQYNLRSRGERTELADDGELPSNKPRNT